MTPDFTRARERMVKEQLIPRGINDPLVLAAMRQVPRHLFIEEALWGEAYNDYPLPIGDRQTISQPYIVALMTQSLGLTGRETILEIGTGSGYQTAVLAECCKKVLSIERIPALVTRARKILDQLHYLNVRLKIFDGTYGWPEEGPFDGILVTAAAPKIPEPYLQQLAPNGRLVIPVGDRYSQTLVRISQGPTGLIEEDLGGVRFVSLIGDHGWGE